MKFEDLQHTLSYIQSELYRVEAMAGTLAMIERDHYNKLTDFDHRVLVDVAVEEQNASRQLGTMKHICLSLAQKVDGISQAIQRGELNGSDVNEVH